MTERGEPLGVLLKSTTRGSPNRCDPGAALDQHSDSCAVFRFRNYCEHLELISQLCSEERQLNGKVGG